MPKITISPGQALLLLIDHYKDNSPKCQELKRLYLSGAINKADGKKINKWLQDKALSAYEVSKDKHTINNDPTRRYFETHLAYETLKESAKTLDRKELQRHFDQIHTMIPAKERAKITHVLHGEFREGDSTLFKNMLIILAKLSVGKFLGNYLLQIGKKLSYW